MPTDATLFYLNPIFLASAGVAFALGLLLLGIIYVILNRIKDKKGGTEMTCPIEVCRSHDTLSLRISVLEGWLKDVVDDLKELRRRVDELERGGYGRRG